MKSTTLIGVVLIVLGLAALVYQGFSYTTEEKILDLGPIEATKQETKTVPLPPIFGGLAVASGVVMVIASTRNGSRTI